MDLPKLARQLTAVLVLVALLLPASSQPLLSQGAQAITLLTDDFEGTSLDTSLWTSVTEGNGKVQVSGGNLTLSGDTATGNAAYVVSKQAFTPGSETTTFQARVKRETEGSQRGWFGLAKGTSTGGGYQGQAGFFITAWGALSAAVFTEGKDWHEQAIANVDTTEWHVYQMIIESNTARFYVDGQLKATLTQDVPDHLAMNVFLEAGNYDSTEKLVVDSVSLNQGDLPDFQISNIAWAPNPPQTLSNADIQVSIKNTGGGYSPDQGTAELELKLRDTGSGDQWRWIYDKDISDLEDSSTVDVEISRFLFTSPDIDEIEVCLEPGDPETDGTNNCRTESITVEEPEETWQSCAGTVINGISVVVERLPVGKIWEGIKEVSRLFTVHTSTITIQCQISDEKCLEAGVDFLVDAAITTAKLISHATILEIISLGKGLFDQLLKSVDCGDFLTGAIRTWIASALHRDEAVSAAVASASDMVDIVVTNSQGQSAGFDQMRSTINEIPNAEVFTSEGYEFILYPGLDTTQVEINGTGSGTTDLIVSLPRDTSEVHTLVWQGVVFNPLAQGVIDTTPLSDSKDGVTEFSYQLVMDDDGDGSADRTIQPSQEIRTPVSRGGVYLPILFR
jgi:hypothetical protein